MGYLRPVDAPITDDWQEHRDRGSAEPGTDYASAYGTPVRAVGAGVVTALTHSNAGAHGRFVQYLLDDGRETRSIHLAEVWIGPGAQLERGQHIGLSGASGFGNDWHYGPHVHHTLWPGRAWDAPTIDFELYVGEEPAPEKRRRDMPAFIRREGFPETYMIAPGFIHCHESNEEKLNNLTEWGMTEADIVVRSDAYMAFTLSCHGFGALIDPEEGTFDLPSPGVTYIEPAGTSWPGIEGRAYGDARRVTEWRRRRATPV